MGMFDHLRCHYTLPIDGAVDIEYQTADLPQPFLEYYEIREDGSLWKRKLVEQWEATTHSGVVRFAACLLYTSPSPRDRG